jgi:hypothetical protein
MASVWALGGALDRIDQDATAGGKREAPFVLTIVANWVDPEEIESNVFSTGSVRHCSASVTVSPTMWAGNDRASQSVPDLRGGLTVLAED